MKLYNVPCNTYIRIVEESNLGDEIFKFHHIDGMYSYCTDAKGSVAHLAAWTEVEIVSNVV